jgi:hypothetical protein
MESVRRACKDVCLPKAAFREHMTALRQVTYPHDPAGFLDLGPEPEMDTDCAGTGERMSGAERRSPAEAEAST